MCGYFTNKACGCAGEWCGAIICIPCKICGANKKSLAKIGYICFSFFWVFISFILLFTAKEIFEWAEDYINCPEGGSACFGTSAIFRMSFVLMLFHILILTVIVPRIQGSAYFHDGCWISKFFLVLSMFIIGFWIPNSFFKVYGYFSLVISFFFLVFQGIVIMGFGYEVNDQIMKFAEHSDTVVYILLAVTILINALSLVFVILQFVWFHGCWANNILIIVPVIFSIIFVVCVILKFRKNSSIFTTAVMTLYLVYLTWTALATRPTESCNPFYQKGYATVLQILFGLVFAFATLIILAVSKAKGDDTKPENVFKNAMAEDSKSEDELDEETPKGDKQKAHVFPITVTTIIFQVFMIFISIYYAMLITNWGRPTVDDDDYDYFIDKWAGFWVKIVVQWVMCGLYQFSLIAPLIFRNREF